MVCVRNKRIERQSQITTVEFSYVNGMILCQHDLPLPQRFTGNALKDLLDIDGPFKIIIDDQEQSWYDAVIRIPTSADDVVRVTIMIMMPFNLVNMRLDKTFFAIEDDPTTFYANNRRKWYKEFWVFAEKEKDVFLHPEGSIGIGIKDLHKVYACILQWNVAHYRKAFPNTCVRRGYVNPRIRERNCCYHSIVHRTKVPHADVKKFVEEWCRLNADLLNELEGYIRMHPYKNFFA